MSRFSPARFISALASVFRHWSRRSTSATAFRSSASTRRPAIGNHQGRGATCFAERSRQVSAVGRRCVGRQRMRRRRCQSRSEIGAARRRRDGRGYDARSHHRTCCNCRERNVSRRRRARAGGVRRRARDVSDARGVRAAQLSVDPNMGAVERARLRALTATASCDVIQPLLPLLACRERWRAAYPGLG